MDEILNAPAVVIHLEDLTKRRDFFTNNNTLAGFTDIRIFKGVDARIPENYHMPNERNNGDNNLCIKYKNLDTNKSIELPKKNFIWNKNSR